MYPETGKNSLKRPQNKQINDIFVYYAYYYIFVADEVTLSYLPCF